MDLLPYSVIRTFTLLPLPLCNMFRSLLSLRPHQISEEWFRNDKINILCVARFMDTEEPSAFSAGDQQVIEHAMRCVPP